MKLSELKETDKNVKVLFEGVAELKPIQAASAHVLLSSAVNVLMCAPIGSGKTYVSLLAICRVATAVQKKSEMKIVYLAPTKALASEMLETFSVPLGRLSLIVKMHTGDNPLTKPELKAAQMIIATPEKWELTLRRMASSDVANACQLLILDEVHLIGDDRGPVLESIVARTIREASNTRILALSATVPNPDDVAKFLNAESFIFGESYRPVPLEKVFVSVKNVSYKHYHRPAERARMDQATFGECLPALQAGRQIIVFVHARKETHRLAQSILAIATRQNNIHLLLPSLTDRSYRRAELDILQSLIPRGVAFHHAGLGFSDRQLVEALFRDQRLRVIVSTATLAMGVNLPAHTVIIKDGWKPKEKWVGEKFNTRQSIDQPTHLEILQMWGRAGRPQFGDSGRAVLVAGDSRMAQLLDILRKGAPLESQMLTRLCDYLNVEAARHTIQNVDHALKWLSSTFLAIRVRLNIQEYSAGVKSDGPLVAYNLLELKCIEALKELHALEMIDFSIDTRSFAILDRGKIASNKFISTKTMVAFLTSSGQMAFSNSLSPAGFLALVCAAEEFDDFEVTDEEEVETLKEMAHHCELEILHAAKKAGWKTSILLQHAVQRLPLSEPHFKVDQRLMIKTVGRVASALKDLIELEKWEDTARDCLPIFSALQKLKPKQKM